VRQNLEISQDYSASCIPAAQRTLPPIPLVLAVDSTSAERLLELSSKLDLGADYMTPIQAWDSIKTHPRAWIWTMERIEEVLKRSYPLLSCHRCVFMLIRTSNSSLITHRHGAALDRVRFQEIIEDILS
jgi:hypothetical protein